MVNMELNIIEIEYPKRIPQKNTQIMYSEVSQQIKTPHYWLLPDLHKTPLKAAMFGALTDFYGWMLEVKFLDNSLVLQLFSII